LTSPAPGPLPARGWDKLIGPPPARQRRQIVLVLGMHRSGTSLCAHVLSALGVDMADEIDPHASNAKGHWERREIVRFHDRILDDFNRGFYTPYHDLSLPVAWWADPRVSEVRREIVSFLTARVGEVPFGFKDPRTVRLLPMWHQIFAELDLEPRIIFCLRNPGQVARSLHERDGFDDDTGELRWFGYVVDFFRYAKNCDICVVEYESWFRDPAENLAKLRNYIEPSWLQRDLDPDPLFAAIIDDRLRHDDQQHHRARLPLVRSLYGLARRAEHEPAARAQILTIAAQYVSFDQMQAGLHRAFERNTALAALATAREEEAAALRVALEQRDAALALADRRVEEATALAEVNAARAAASAARAKQALAEVARLPQQRIAAQLAAAEAVHAEVAGLRAALAAAERKIAGGQEQSDRIGVAQASAAPEPRARLEQGREPIELHEALAVSDRLVGELRASAEREMAAAMASIADLTTQLAERSAQTGAVAAREAGSRAEIEQQLHSLRELSRQRDTAQVAARAAQDDIARLRAALAAAEQHAREREAELESAAATRIADLTARLAERAREAAESQTRAEKLYAEELAATRALRQGAGWLARLVRRARHQPVGAAIRAGDAAIRSGDAAAAVRHYRRALDGSPGLTAIWVQLGHALKARGDYHDAEAAYRRALALDGSVADTHLQLGHLLKLSSRWVEAADAYARALQLDPGMQHAADELEAVCPSLLAQGDKARDAQDWPEAARHYRSALDHQPGRPQTWVQLGRVLQEQGDYGGAETACRRALTLDEASADAHLQLAHALKLSCRWGEAADSYARALQLDPGLPQAACELERLSPLLVQQGDKASEAENWAAAAWYYRRALEPPCPRRQPGSASVWVRLGQALERHGDPVAAEAAYRSALALDGAAAEAHASLGRLLALQGRRSQAIDAYAGAVRLAPDLTDASAALHALLIEAPPDAGNPPPIVAGAATPEVRLPTAAPTAAPGHDVIWLGVIDWHYRIQRPQHLATNLADLGARVFYVSLVFEPPDDKGRFRIIESPHRNVFEVRMRFPGNASENLYRGLSARAVAELQLGLDELIGVLGVRAPVIVVEHPAWQPVACGVPGATIVYDCLDLATGFSTAAKTTATYEAAMLATADLVVAASHPLIEHIAATRSSILVRNAADVEFFAQGFTDRPVGERPVIGYFGAIAEWFNIEWIERCAAARPDWDFRLVGRTDGCNVSHAARLPNVSFLGEQPYRELPRFLREIDVAVIPFKMIELIRCTNPVKLYEYMAAGKPVVAAPMPEVVEATELAYIAEDAASFADRIAQALAEDSVALRLRRLAWAREHTWPSRARQLHAAIEASLPPVSVVVLTYNNWEYTRACLASLRDYSDYPDLEIIVVDNASSDGTPENLCQLQRQDPRIRVVLNDANLGFAAGNNVGLRLARGEFVILLNNDTVVTRGWVRDLIRPMQLDPRIGLTGPLTNAIGNEQKVKPGYDIVRDMPQWARRFVRDRLRHTVETSNLAFFCVAIRRSVLDEVGLLDEVYGVVFYEDDDYCRRARQADYKLVIVDDVFVHHHLSASVAALGSQAVGEFMARNKAIFEARWGEWQPHRYRDEPGFGV
jgi:GT2 family glycosyltransferase/tetratricopeptide (TPR) repeat protein